MNRPFEFRDHLIIMKYLPSQCQDEHSECTSDDVTVRLLSNVGQMADERLFYLVPTDLILKSH